jgi:hypothetical protein
MQTTTTWRERHSFNWQSQCRMQFLYPTRKKSMEIKKNTHIHVQGLTGLHITSSNESRI